MILKRYKKNLNVITKSIEMETEKYKFNLESL